MDSDAGNMASKLSLHCSMLLTFFHLLLLPGVAPHPSRYSAIFSFGDSLTDTGNVFYFPRIKPLQPPYGKTYFGHPSGRMSDGRLVIDFIAQALGLPLVPPYLAGNRSENFEHGANFAVSGACALSTASFRAAGFSFATWKDHSLSTQLKWFEQMLLPTVHAADGEDILRSSLFLIGEMGVNDYSYMLSLLDERRSIDRLRPYVPAVVHAICSAVNALIQTGAKTVMVAGIFPMGCMPTYLSHFHSEGVQEYDPKTGCNNRLNEFSQHHNLLLQQELDRLRKLHPQSNIIYADYYEAMLPIYRSPRTFGIKALLAACCGGEGPYNFSFDAKCGNPMSRVCSDPSNYVSWDGLHLTEAAHRIIARHIVDGLQI